MIHIKQYANFLGADGERIVREMSRTVGVKPGGFHYGIGSIERRREMAPAWLAPRTAGAAPGPVS